MRVYFTQLGCKLNQAELEALARRFAAAGHAVAGTLEEADLHVVNTCSVTQAAARDSRKLARRGRRANPRMRTVLTGCYVASDPEEAAGLDGVDLLVGNHDKESLLERVEAAFPELASELAPVPIPYVPLPFGNTRAAVKIEDGCNMRCAFCIIPSTRGRQRSRHPDEVIEEVGRLARAGFQEVVITGVQISAYRGDGARLYDLVARLLEETAIPRLRLTSIAPWDLDERLLGLFPSGRLCRHFHFSLQSGCAATLRRMRRPYAPAAYAELIAKVREAIPGVAVTTDVIVGFPGETEAEFEECLGFVACCAFARIHAFPYSERPGTAAAEMPHPVPHSTRRLRMARMLDVAAASRRAFWSGRLGEEAQVLWERWKDGRWLGTSDHYVQVSASRGSANWPTSGLGWARLVAMGDDTVDALPLEGPSA